MLEGGDRAPSRCPPVGAGAEAPEDARSVVLQVVLASLLLVAGVAIM